MQRLANRPEFIHKRHSEAIDVPRISIVGGKPSAYRRGRMPYGFSTAVETDDDVIKRLHRGGVGRCEHLLTHAPDECLRSALTRLRA